MKNKMHVFYSFLNNYTLLITFKLKLCYLRAYVCKLTLRLIKFIALTMTQFYFTTKKQNVNILSLGAYTTHDTFVKVWLYTLICNEV